MNETAYKKVFKKNKLKCLRLTLKYRPKIMQLILKMRQAIRRKNEEIKSLKKRLKQVDKLQIQKGEGDQATSDINHMVDKSKEFIDSSTQTLECIKNKKVKDRKKDTPHIEETKVDLIVKEVDCKETKTDQIESDVMPETSVDTGWNIDPNSTENVKSIAEQVKEVAQSALRETGMVYVESAGMYYDYKTGYYYNSELGLYYHTDTGCYYCFSDEKQQFVFHSYPDTSAVNTSLIAHQKKKARKLLKRERKREDDIDNLTKTLSQAKEDSEMKRRKIKKSKKNGLSKKGKKEQCGAKKKEDVVKIPETKNGDDSKKTDVEMDVATKETEAAEGTDIFEIKDDKRNEEEKIEKEIDIEMKSADGESELKVSRELEDGECSESSSDDDDDNSSNSTTSTVSDEDSIAKHHPPCMRVIVRETDLPKLKVGSLFLITKDGGTIGREGDHHMILIKDTNVSRNHLDIRYDVARRTYVAIDLGSKNGTILNGNRMSESTEISNPMDILHGSTIQLGETKLLCHIHPGNDTCGHCEPGLIMESEDKEKKVAYTRNCSVKKQHELELARLKNIYAPKLLEIEEKPYNDRAQARRETVGSSHHSAKTESTDLDTSISTENKGFKLLQKMGWSKGEGLGRDNQGKTEPVPLLSNEGKAGLGTSGAVGPPTAKFTPRPKNTVAGALRLANRTKMLQPPAKAFQNEEDEESE